MLIDVTNTDHYANLKRCVIPAQISAFILVSCSNLMKLFWLLVIDAQTPTRALSVETFLIHESEL